MRPREGGDQANEGEKEAGETEATGPAAGDGAEALKDVPRGNNDRACIARAGFAGLAAKGTTGTTNRATARHTTPNNAMLQNSPDKPPAPTINGAATKANANDKPIEPPTIAIARVRTSGRVASANQAVIAAEIAPEP